MRPLLPIPRFPLRLRHVLLALALGTTVAAAQGVKRASVTAEAPFLAETDAAMGPMMSGMAIKPTGDVDADFAAMMIPHHQGAIDMAQAELRYGRNQQLRRIAQEIVVEQGQEIAAMRLALGQPLPLPAAPQSAAAPSHGASRHPEIKP